MKRLALFSALLLCIFTIPLSASEEVDACRDIERVCHDHCDIPFMNCVISAPNLGYDLCRDQHDVCIEECTSGFGGDFWCGYRSI